MLDRGNATGRFAVYGEQESQRGSSGLSDCLISSWQGKPSEMRYACKGRGVCRQELTSPYSIVSTQACSVPYDAEYRVRHTIFNHAGHYVGMMVLNRQG